MARQAGARLAARSLGRGITGGKRTFHPRRPDQSQGRVFTQQRATRLPPLTPTLPNSRAASWGEALQGPAGTQPSGCIPPTGDSGDSRRMIDSQENQDVPGNHQHEVEEQPCLQSG